MKIKNSLNQSAFWNWGRFFLKKLYLLIFSICLSHNFFSQEIDTIETHSKENQKVKKGFSLGAIPIFSFDSDVGLKYGALTNLYHYGDGSRYPTYNHSLFLRWYQTTKGSSISELKYDSDKLLRGLRLTLGAFYQTEKALNFYGFNGYKSYYNKNFEEKDDPEYISAVFYRHERKVVRINADFQGKMSKNLRWLGGFSFLNSKIAKVDIDKLNKGRDEDDLLPKVDGIYDLYVNWKVLPESERNGGENSFLKAGLVYNSTDNEADPSSGLWTEALVFFAPESFGFEATTSIISLIHRQYITLFHEHFKVAYRIGYQTKISGKMPFYLLPYLTDSRNTVDAFGGAKTLRGILRNRIVGNGSAFGNVELRYKIFQATLLKQNFHIVLNAFTDFARVVDPYTLNLQNVPAEYLYWFNYQNENWHLSYGAGIRFILNHNFIVAVDYGMATNEQDGINGIYVGMDFLF